MTTLHSAAIATASLFLMSIAFAQQPTGTPSEPATPKPATPATTTTKQAAPSAADMDKQLAQMQEQMKKMQEQMNKIRATKDPAERQRLLQGHWQSMQSAMTTMHSLWGATCCGAGPAAGGGPMMGGGQMGGHMMGGGMTMGPMWGDYSKLTPEQLKQRQYMMEHMLPMQQMMMEQMMQHQHWMMQQPPPPPK